jgi:hypothetical protein
MPLGGHSKEVQHMPRDELSSLEVVHPEGSGSRVGDVSGGNMASPGETMDASTMPPGDTAMDAGTLSNPDTASDADSTADDTAPENAADA